MKLSTNYDLKLRNLDEEARTDTYGPPPENPFEDLRLSFDFSLGELATQTKISKQALRRAEYGLYTNPLPSLVEWWIKWPRAKHLELSEGQLTNGYYDFQVATRLRYRHYFGPSLSVDPYLGQHPFRQLRANRPSFYSADPLPVGLLECARALCVPLDTIQHWEKKFRTQRIVPRTILNALNQMGYSRPALQEFETNYGIYRGRYLSV